MWQAVVDTLIMLRNGQYHGLYGSTSCCIRQWPKQMGRAIFDHPQRQNHWTDFNKTWNIELDTGDHPACKLWLRYGDVGGLGKKPVCHCLFSFFLFGFFAKATGRTVHPIWTNEGSKRVVPLKEVPIGGLNDVSLNFGGKFLQKLKLWQRK